MEAYVIIQYQLCVTLKGQVSARRRLPEFGVQQNATSRQVADLFAPRLPSMMGGEQILGDQVLLRARGLMVHLASDRTRYKSARTVQSCNAFHCVVPAAVGCAMSSTLARTATANGWTCELSPVPRTYTKQQVKIMMPLKEFTLLHSLAGRNMFKKLLKSLDSTPSTPKMGRVELPDVGEGDVYYISTTDTSVIGKDWSSDSEGSSSPRSPIAPWRRPLTPQPNGLKPRRRPSAPQPDSPLSPRRGSSSSQTEGRKPISRSSTPRVEDRGCSRSATPQPGLSQVTERSSSPVPAKSVPKGILKPAPPPQPVTLHWQLLPYETPKSKKKLYFDVAHPPHLIRDHSHMPPVVLHSADMGKLASEIPLTEMNIRCSQLPHWDIEVSPSRPGGVRCFDVFQAIYETFHWRLARCEAAFRARCKATPGLHDVELSHGMRRVDILEGRTIFMGLRRPIPSDDKPDRYWVLELGFPQNSR
ncbi:hypothetical protein IEO21_04115 [Rhodonia placenta]|uniref:DUF6699 domain-containing protein n=1 Tax=Rhodonia placenta TaxID=104341 RepID=A0A8H7P4F8_9APHY|nr:hypothetical protein IEO21_04115 [Postia placenta]